MRFPIIKVYDKGTDTEHIVGTDVHDQLDINNGNDITYYNLQNGEGTGEFGDYSFVGKDNDEYGVTVEFVTFDELKRIHDEQKTRDNEANEQREKFLKRLFEQEKENNSSGVRPGGF